MTYMTDAKIIPFKRPTPKREDKLIKISDEIDNIILGALRDPDMDYKELVALVAHRLGALLKGVEEKKVLWDFCKKVIGKQSGAE